MSPDNCTCWTDERYWFGWAGYTEPGSQKEYDHDCPEHGDSECAIQGHQDVPDNIGWVMCYRCGRQERLPRLSPTGKIS